MPVRCSWWCALMLAVAGSAGCALTVRDGRLLRDGKPGHVVGLNVRDLADDILDKGAEAKDCFEAIRYLGEHKVPFIRFWASYFNNRKKYLANPARYWEHMDLLVAACEKAGVGLAPTLFWDSWQVPWTFDEYCQDWGRADSRTRQFCAQYTREFGARYKDRPIVWLWEFSNENNLMWDLPNTMQFLPKDRQDPRNIARYEVGQTAIRTFAETVRQLDGRAISSGCSSPRGSQYHLAKDPAHPWNPDSLDEHVTAAGWTAPDPVDLYCVHYYVPHLKYDAARARAGLKVEVDTAARLGKPLYVGELGVLDAKGKVDADFDAAAYRAHARDLLDAVYEAKVPLAARWVYAAKNWGYGMGVVTPAYGKFDYIVDLLAEVNQRP